MAFEQTSAPAGAPRIEGTRGGRFLVSGKAHPGGLRLWRGGVENVDLRSVSELAPAHFEPLLALDPPPDVILIGTGTALTWPDFDLLGWLRENGAGPEVMDSMAAARTFNLLVAEEREVGALILPLR